MEEVLVQAVWVVDFQALLDLGQITIVRELVDLEGIVFENGERLPILPAKLSYKIAIVEEK